MFTVSLNQRETGHVHTRHKEARRGTAVLSLQGESDLLWGVSLRNSFCTKSKFSRTSITSFSGGVLSLKHTVETRSKKKLLHICRRQACFLMASLGNERLGGTVNGHGERAPEGPPPPTASGCGRHSVFYNRKRHSVFYNRKMQLSPYPDGTWVRAARCYADASLSRSTLVLRTSEQHPFTLKSAKTLMCVQG